MQLLMWLCIHWIQSKHVSNHLTDFSNLVDFVGFIKDCYLLHLDPFQEVQVVCAILMKLSVATYRS